MKLRWLPERLEEAYVHEALQSSGIVVSVSAEKWRVTGVENMQTLYVVFSLVNVQWPSALFPTSCVRSSNTMTCCDSWGAALVHTLQLDRPQLPSMPQAPV